MTQILTPPHRAASVAASRRCSRQCPPSPHAPLSTYPAEHLAHLRQHRADAPGIWTATPQHSAPCACCQKRTPGLHARNASRRSLEFVCRQRSTWTLSYSTAVSEPLEIHFTKALGRVHVIDLWPMGTHLHGCKGSKTMRQNRPGPHLDPVIKN